MSPEQVESARLHMRQTDRMREAPDGWLRVSLIVKDGDGASTVVLRKLNEWFTEGPRDAPYPAGTLLCYSMHAEGIDAADLANATDTARRRGPDVNALVIYDFEG